MEARSPAEAFNAFASPIRRTASCVTRVVPMGDGFAPGGEHSLTLLDVPLRTRSAGRLMLRFIIEYRVRQVPGRTHGWRTEATSYMYVVSDADGVELLSYHWNPESSSSALPHLHLGPGLKVAPGVVQRAHLVTGMVTPADIVQMCVEEFRVAPLRPDWHRVVEEARK